MYGDGLCDYMHTSSGNIELNDPKRIDTLLTPLLSFVQVLHHFNSTLRFSVYFGKRRHRTANYLLLIPHPDIDFFTPKIRPGAYYWTRKPKIRPRRAVKIK